MSANSRERRASSTERTTKARPTISISNSSPARTPKASTASGGNETEAASSRVDILFDISVTFLARNSTSLPCGNEPTTILPILSSLKCADNPRLRFFDAISQGHAIAVMQQSDSFLSPQNYAGSRRELFFDALIIQLLKPIISR